jgi:hypothetical protein
VLSSLITEKSKDLGTSVAAGLLIWWLFFVCVRRGVGVPALVRGGRGDEAHQREGAVLQRAHLPPEQDPDRQGR